ncbi:DUF5053 domain-containing protein [Alistipes shahii]|jgi:hypothetical protein|uniref:DUF5053 domain-containing protein n=1 Tax=Alistipes shahii TaxID=328814 RepID=UPI00207006E5|nr:DUF5053 domain-containing protein [Alistipes shahii]DAZ08325.1 MAG TPA: protein of unknown function (DUF5053) [Caudoviricetes sp.]
MNAQLEKLQARFMKATTDAEREDVRKEMRKLCDADAPGLAAAALESIKATNAEVAEILLREQLKDILPAVSLAYVAKTYFNKTRQWLYQRINGTLVNGKPAKFTPEEITTLNNALRDIANRLSSINVSA